VGLRITKLFPVLGNSTPVKRKDTTDVTAVGDRPDKEGNRDQYDHNQNQQNDKREFTKEDLEKAVTDMQKDPSFLSAGLHAEIITTKDGTKIHLTQAAGSNLKIMSAEEFLKLRESSTQEDSGRGKILDQKF
jgi:hypothetical protein